MDSLWPGLTVVAVNGQWRNPYVGEGEDGARRSARIDQEEAEGLAWSDPRRAELETSSERWAAQARELMLRRVGERPTLAQVRAGVGSERWLAALALVDLSPGLSAELAGWTSWASEDGTFTYEGEVATFHPMPLMRWEEWAADVDERGRGWSSTERRLAGLVMALTVDRPVRLVGVLDGLGDAETDALRVLVEWATGGRVTTRAALGVAPGQRQDSAPPSVRSARGLRLHELSEARSDQAAMRRRASMRTMRADEPEETR